MYTVGVNGNNVAYGRTHYIADIELDKYDIADKTMGSTCFVIETSNYYMLNGSGLWILIHPYKIDGSGSGTYPTSVVYDGGVVRQ